MQIKRFEAESMPEALRLIKKEFGSEAVILSAKSLRKESMIFGPWKKPGVIVTAAVDGYLQKAGTGGLSNKAGEAGNFQEELAGLSAIGYKKKKGLIKSFQAGFKTTQSKHNSLVQSNCYFPDDSRDIITLRRNILSQGVEEDIALQLIDKLKKIGSINTFLKNDRLKNGLVNILDRMGITSSPIRIGNGKKKLIAFIGPTGVGKTSTVAKLAAAIAIDMKKDVALITLDNYRIGAVAELEIYARIIGVPMKTAFNSKELKRTIKEFKEVDVILIDTAGISRKDERQFNDLKAFFDKIRMDEIHLLLSATTKDDDLDDIVKNYKLFPVNRLIFTKLDETATYGNMLNQLIKSKIPISYFTNGQQIPEDIHEATMEKLAGLLVDQAKVMAHWSGYREELKEEDEIYYVANKNSDIFHYAGCKWAMKIKKENMIRLETISDAKSKNLLPCKYCRPMGKDVERSSFNMFDVSASMEERKTGS
ncbi:MAG: flagellar biosynthesis protein FlhF [Thermodesulfobacteriota bacterium]|nr:flagellar biosynthesis protein FlhF [Thermodesulfobacteriota bacterium]